MCILYFKKRGELWMIKNPQQYQEILRLKREKEMNKHLKRDKRSFPDVGTVIIETRNF